MKTLFKSFYNPTENELKDLLQSKETLFAFDTNVLLNLYAYGEQTRSDFFKVINALTGTVWLPHHVGLEYHRRRIDVIKDEKAIFDKIRNLLDEIEKPFVGNGEFIKLSLKKRFPSLDEKTNNLHSEIKSSIKKYKEYVDELDKNQPSVNSEDAIRDRIYKIFDGKIGCAPESQDWLDKLYKEGAVRYENKIPPGFKDKVKSSQENSTFLYGDLSYQSEYGDLILWEQLIEKAKSDNIKNVIFVTDDVKSDWWFTVKSRGDKRIGPLQSLIDEMQRKADIEIFHMYTTSQFLEDANTQLNVKVDRNSIDEVESHGDSSIKKSNVDVMDLMDTLSADTSLSDINHHLHYRNDKNQKVYYGESSLPDSIIQYLNDIAFRKESSRSIEQDYFRDDDYDKPFIRHSHRNKNYIGDSERSIRYRKENRNFDSRNRKLDSYYSESEQRFKKDQDFQRRIDELYELYDKQNNRPNSREDDE